MFTAELRLWPQQLAGNRGSVGPQKRISQFRGIFRQIHNLRQHRRLIVFIRRHQVKMIALIATSLDALVEIVKAQGVKPEIDPKKD